MDPAGVPLPEDLLKMSSEPVEENVSSWSGHSTHFLILYEKYNILLRNAVKYNGGKKSFFEVVIIIEKMCLLIFLRKLIQYKEQF